MHQGARWLREELRQELGEWKAAGWQPQNEKRRAKLVLLLAVPQVDYFNKRRVLEERQKLMYAQGSLPQPGKSA